MKKFLAVLCAAVLSVCCGAVLAGCDQGETLKIGYTEYAPMNYVDEKDGVFKGHDTDFAKKLCKELGYKCEFVLINWDKKVLDLKSGVIDLVWNGMTIKEELRAEMLISDPYMENQQVLVAKTENLAKYSKSEDLVGTAKIAVEAGSAAADAVKAIEGVKESQIVEAQSQAKALLEVKSGTADAAVIDLTMAKAMTGEGTDYADIGWKDVGFAKEEYGIGARLEDTALMEKINAKIKEYKENGYLTDLYQKYMVG